MNNKKSLNTEEKLQLIISKNKLMNLKSDYFLEKVFNVIRQKIKLEIIKYNKNIQKRVKININDYKEYSEIFSSIEIEIIPIKNLNNDFLNKFININTEDEKYYHIYFNDNKMEEIERTYLNKGEIISKIKIIIIYFSSKVVIKGN